MFYIIIDIITIVTITMIKVISITKIRFILKTSMNNLDERPAMGEQSSPGVRRA